MITNASMIVKEFVTVLKVFANMVWARTTWACRAVPGGGAA
jgi:hypothetical protein